MTSSTPPSTDRRPVLPLEYRNTYAPRRPGILTAIGVISILYGAMSLLGNSFGVANNIYRLGVKAPATVVPTTAPGGVITYPGFEYQYNDITLKVSLTACVLEGGLALLLVIAGIKTLRDQFGAARLHRIFAIAKIPLIFIAVIASWLINSGMMRDLSRRTGTRVVGPGFFFVPALICAAIGLAYVVTLLIVLNLPGVKRFYKYLRSGEE